MTGRPTPNLSRLARAARAVVAIVLLLTLATSLRGEDLADGWRAVSATAPLAATPIAGNAQTWQWSPSAVHHAAVCRVTADSGRARSSGSGCYVQLGAVRGVLTAGHCVEGRVTIHWSDGTQTPGEALTDRTGADLAFVPAYHRTLRPLTVSTTPPFNGQRLECCGFGGPRDTLRHWWGSLSASRGATMGGSPVSSYTSAVMQGDSGGPVLTERVEVVGVLTTGQGQRIGAVGASQAFRGSGGPSYQVIAAFASRLALRGAEMGCGPGGCGPGLFGGGRFGGGRFGGDDSWAYPPSPSPGSGAPPLAPIPPDAPPPFVSPPTPGTPGVPPSAGCCPGGVIYQVDYQRLAEQLLPLLAEDPQLRGPEGKPGADGRPGPAGPALTPEQTEQLYQRLLTVLATDPRFRPTPSVEQLAAAVAAALPPVRLQLLGADGQVQQAQSKPLGEPLRLQLVPE